MAEGDELLRSFTGDDETGVLRRFASEQVPEDWWWRRIPASGPVREELDAFDRQPG